MTTTIQQMNEKMSKIAGTNVETTIRGVNKFTFMVDGLNEVAARKINDFFMLESSRVNSIEITNDAECDASFVYVELN